MASCRAILLSLLLINARPGQGAGEWRKEYPPWGETGVATEGAEELWLPLIGPFTRHGCFPSRYMSMRIAVSHVNRRDATFCPAIATLSNNFEIRYDMWDTSSNPVGTASATMKILGNETTKAKTKVVLGPNGSGSSKASSQILSVFGIPQISWASTNADLSNKASYPFYFRSVSPDSLVMKVLAGFIANLGFALANLVYFDASFQTGQSDDFRLAAESLPTLDVMTFKVPNSGAGGAAISEVNKLEVRKSLRAIQQTGCRVVVGVAINEEAFDLWSEADALGMVHSAGWMWFGADGISGGQIAGDLSRVDLFEGSIFIITSSQGPDFQKFADQWAADMPTTDVPEFTTMPICKDGIICQGEADFTGWQAGVHDTSLACTGYTALAYDALVTLAVVADRLMTDESGNSRTLASLTSDDWFQGMKALITEGYAFDCLSGEVSYDENQERPLPMSFFNWQSGSLVPQGVADWSGVSGYSWRVGENLVWPDRSTVSIAIATEVPPGLPSGLPPPCSSGEFYNNTAALCQACAAGSRASQVGTQVACVQCDPGTYQPEAGQITCISCPAGHASGLYGLENCEDPSFQCQEGFFAAEPGATECSSCEVGRSQAEKGSRTCSLCPEAHYQDETGSQDCKMCQSYLPASTCGRGAVNASECHCPAGTLHKLSGESWTCAGCPEGLECLGGESEPLHVPGFWAEAVDETSREYEVFRCRDVLQCPSGPISSCQFGREGRACSSCKVGYFRGDGGRCEVCGGVDYVPIVLLALALVVGTTCAAIFFRNDPTKQSLTMMTVLATAGQLVTVMQTMGVLRQLSVSWVEPIKSILSLTSLLTFNLDVIKISCFMPKDDPLAKFVLQLLFYPIAVMGLACVYLVLKVAKKAVPLDNMFNFNGLFLMAMYISLSLMVLLPFQCVSNPGGKTFSMSTNPGVLCWTDGSHVAMAVLAVFGVIAYPLTIFCWILFTTIQYPARISSGLGLQTLKRYNFLFNRFKPDVYFYGCLMLFRNFLAALIPVALVGVPAVQLVMLCLLLLVSVAIQSRLWPWRTDAANRADLIMSLSMILVIAAAGPLLEVDDAQKQDVLGIVMLFPLLGIPIACIAAVGWEVYKRVSQTTQFAAFLCHHKGGAGSLGRFIKLIMGKHSASNIFYDSDQLEDLDLIFEVVRARTKTLVILLSPEVQKRMWCAGEIVSAHRNNIPIVLLSCDKCGPLDKLAVENIQDVWTSEQKNTLLQYHITMDMVKDAYSYLQTLPVVSLQRYASMEDQESAVLDLMKQSKISTKAFSKNRMSVSTERASILITGAVLNAEAYSTCLNLSMLVQQTTRVEAKVVRDVGQVKEALAVAGYLVVVLSKELLKDESFAKLLLACVEGRVEEPIEIVTVNGDTSFEFPPLEFFKDLEEKGLGSDLGPRYGPRLAKAYRSLLSVLALPLSPHGSEALLAEQVREVCRRFRTLEDLAKGTKMFQVETLDEAEEAAEVNPASAVVEVVLEEEF